MFLGEILVKDQQARKHLHDVIFGNRRQQFEDLALSAVEKQSQSEIMAGST